MAGFWSDQFQEILVMELQQAAVGGGGDRGRAGIVLQQAHFAEIDAVFGLEADHHPFLGGVFVQHQGELLGDLHFPGWP